MRLANGIVIDKEATFATFNFSTLRCYLHIQNEVEAMFDEIKECTYDLKSKDQGCMLQIFLIIALLFYGKAIMQTNWKNLSLL
ncbi:DUF961 family protein [Clostridioides sp. ES-S-0010-02]|nr:DUF961 family protein [Clostridioides sp. ES-S-0010-02]